MEWLDETAPGSRLRLAVVVLKIAAGFFFLAGVPCGVYVVLFSLAGNNPGVGLSLLLVTLCLVIGEWALTAVRGLEGRKRWARDSANFIFGLLCLLGVGLPLGGVGLWALNSKEARSEFERGDPEDV
jgi:hypothetical protein